MDSGSESDSYIFKPKKSISRTPTRNDGDYKSEMSNKRPRSETSPELNSTKRQCDTMNMIDNTIRSGSPIISNNETMPTEVHIVKILSALEKMDEITREDIKLTKNTQTDLRDMISSLQRNLTLFVYRFASLEKENLMLKHEFEMGNYKQSEQRIIQTKIDKQEKPQYKKTYANSLSSTTNQQLRDPEKQ